MPVRLRGSCVVCSDVALLRWSSGDDGGGLL